MLYLDSADGRRGYFSMRDNLSAASNMSCSALSSFSSSSLSLCESSMARSSSESGEGSSLSRSLLQIDGLTRDSPVRLAWIALITQMAKKGERSENLQLGIKY
ncbi:Hypothetical protein NTJ_10550 [Nesidiocoris tenuis]|uniref:Uncharacterized protein n=1 Tax=Nesidiocoris tenuis TaxID=355587 RepID=A0ABN7AZZ5_9HEMI|nr:Hypothetical protein NTJ_10550 [Nesidiocoris tenuis]